MLRRHPLPRSAPPAPSDTTSAAPIRMPGTRPPSQSTSIVLGFLTRVVAFIASGEMAVAYFVGHMASEEAFLFPVAAKGPGAWSLDALVRRVGRVGH